MWGALIFAAVLHAAHSRRRIAGASIWLNSHPMHDGQSWRYTATLVRQSGVNEFNSVLWSLNWEVRYSLLLPGLVLLPIVTRRHPIAAAASAVGCFALIGYGTQHSEFQILEYLPMFVLGSLFAFHEQRLRVVVRSRIWSAVFEVVMLVIGVGLLTVAFWTGPPVGAGGANGVQEMVAVLGACILVWGALNLPRTRAGLETRPMQWLGSRSFSLYLVHEPIGRHAGVRHGRPSRRGRIRRACADLLASRGRGLLEARRTALNTSVPDQRRCREAESRPYADASEERAKEPKDHFAQGLPGGTSVWPGSGRYRVANRRGEPGRPFASRGRGAVLP